MWELLLGQAAAAASCVQIARQQCYRMPTAATVAAAANVATAEDEEKPNEQKREVASATPITSATAQVMLVLELHFWCF